MAEGILNHVITIYSANHRQVGWYEEAADTLADQSSEPRHCPNLIDKMPRISDLKVISLATNKEV